MADPEQRRPHAVSRVAEDRIAAIAAGQHGVVARGQLLADGINPRVLDSLVRSRRLQLLHRGVYLLGRLRGPLEPERAREMAAALACGRGAVVSHMSVAWLWNMLPRPEGSVRRDVDVSIPGEARRKRPGIRIHRSSDLGAAETTVLDGIPVTTPARTLRDLSTVVSARELNRAAARAERKNLLAADDLDALLARHGRHPGAPVLRVALRDSGGLVFTRSEAEDRLLELVRLGGLRAPETNVRIRGYELDCYWRPERVAIEVDGFAFHASRRSFENDRRRDNDLAAAGIQVLRVTWRRLVHEPHAVLVCLAQALARAEAGVRA